MSTEGIHIFWARTDLSPAAKLVGIRLGDSAQHCEIVVDIEGLIAWSGLADDGALYEALDELERVGLFDWRSDGGMIYGRVVGLPNEAQSGGEPSPSRRARRERVFSKTDGKCFYCDDPAVQMDHMIPRARGGADAIENMIGACVRCNAQKGARTAAEFFSWLNGGPGNE